LGASLAGGRFAAGDTDGDDDGGGIAALLLGFFFSGVVAVDLVEAF
jgi:hypothetical protein